MFSFDSVISKWWDRRAVRTVAWLFILFVVYFQLPGLWFLNGSFLLPIFLSLYPVSSSPTDTHTHMHNRKYEICIYSRVFRFERIGGE